MEILNKFIEAFKARVVLKANQGIKARKTEFNETVDAVTEAHGAIPNIGKIRSYLFKCLDGKSNWGSRMVISEFDYAVSKINGDD